MNENLLRKELVVGYSSSDLLSQHSGEDLKFVTSLVYRVRDPASKQAQLQMAGHVGMQAQCG